MVDVLDDDIRSPLMYAITKQLNNPDFNPNFTETLTTLLKAGSDPNTSDKTETPPIQNLVKINDLTAVRAVTEYSSLFLCDNTLDYVCTVTQSSAMLECLLLSSRPSYYSLTQLLIHALSVEPSAWTPGQQEQVKKNHDIARVLIEQINPEFAIELDILFREDSNRSFQIEEAIGDVYESFGLIGVALNFGKLSIADMLYIAGFRCPEFFSMLEADWMKTILDNERALNWMENVKFYITECKTTSDDDFYDSEDEKDKVKNKSQGLDDISPYNVNIERQTNTMFDNAYSHREESRAAVSKITSVYD